MKKQIHKERSFFHNWKHFSRYSEAQSYFFSYFSLFGFIDFIHSLLDAHFHFFLVLQMYMLIVFDHIIRLEIASQLGT